ncbi:zinc finger and SCAN domain-containing protein 2 [Oryzias latipes]|uniref:zinc finger and SCAN domain-containing protein 2 n=1 Tax=Oryzias latipes TaxID=8090 RepID=UPI0009D9AE31|nr:zinc finger and SCAN domain-containing protein 2 [Oryzias latipes]
MEFDVNTRAAAVKMSSVQSLREFIGERLTAAAEEIFTHVEQTIFKLEAELERQRRLLDIVLQPHMQLQTAGLPPTYPRNEEDAELQQIKEQEEEICISQDEEQPGLKQEANTLMETHFYQENDFSEEDLNSQQLQAQSFNDGQDEEDHQEASSTDREAGPHSREDTDRSHVGERRCHSDLENVSEVNCHGENPFNKRTLAKKRQRSQNVRRHSCKECGKTFKTAHCLTYHRRTHTGEKPFCCNVCAKSFHLSSSLKNHMMIHTGARPFSCAECGKRFSRTSTLKTHMVTHTGARPFSCQQCGKRFSRASTLKSHMISHTGAKPFFCALCAKGFTRSFHLKCHMRTHRADAGLL